MNAVIDAIRQRRSVRSYEPKPVPAEIIKTLVDCANEAASGMNTQPWRFVVVRDECLKRKLVTTAVPNSLKYLEPVKQVNPQRWELIQKRYEQLPDPVYYSAPAIIFVVGSGTYAADSCPMACGNIMLAAHSLGLGTCWVKLGSLVRDNADIVQALGLKEDEQIFGPILVGYPKSTPERPAKKSATVNWI